MTGAADPQWLYHLWISLACFTEFVNWGTQVRKCPSMTGMILWICQLSYLAHESSPFTLKRMKIYLFKFTMNVGELMHREKKILLGIQATLMLKTLSVSMKVIKNEAQEQQGYKLQTTHLLRREWHLFITHWQNLISDTHLTFTKRGV